MYAAVKDFVNTKIYQYEVTTALYMLEPWEKTLFNSILIVGVCLALNAVYQYAPSTLAKLSL